MWEFVLRDQGKIEVCHFLFLPLINSMPNTFWTSLPLLHMLCFCFWGLHTRSKPAFPGRSAWRDKDLPVLLVSLQPGHLHEHQPYHMECRSGAIFLKLTPALTIQLWGTNKTPFSTLFISCKTDSPGQWQEKKSYIKEVRHILFSLMVLLSGIDGGFSCEW